MTLIQKSLIASIFIYLLAILFGGYLFGGSDQIEILPVLKYWLSDETLYRHDFYMSYFSEKAITERSAFLYLLYYMGITTPSAFFVAHIVVSLALILGLIYVTEYLTKSFYVAQLIVAIIILIGPYTSVGSNELFYHYLIPSLPAKALGVWSLYFWLKNKAWPTTIFLTISTFMQPLVGMQLFLIIASVELFKALKRQKFEWRILLYLVLIGPWIYLLLSQQGHSAISKELYFEILEFRVGHHFFIHETTWIDLLIFLGFTLASIFYFRKRNSTISLFVGISFLGLLIYVALTEFYPLKLAANTQWMKTTIWLEWLGLIAIVQILRHAFPTLTREKHMKFYLLTLATASVLLILGGIKHPAYELPFLKNVTSESEAGNWIINHTSASTVILPSPEMTRLKYVSSRSSYLDFKAMIHHEDYMADYYERVKSVYGISLGDRKKLGASGMLEKAKKGLNENAEFLMITGKADLLVTSLPQTEEHFRLKYKTTSQPTVYIYGLSARNE